MFSRLNRYCLVTVTVIIKRYVLSVCLQELSRAKREQYFVIAFVIAVFNNMRTLNFKAQLTIGFFSANNQNYSDSPGTLS